MSFLHLHTTLIISSMPLDLATSPCSATSVSNVKGLLMSKQLLILLIGATSVMASPAFAETEGTFTGAFIGGEVGLQRNKYEITAPGNIGLKDRDQGFNLRGFAGYDITMSDRFVLGAELGIGRGGPEVDDEDATAAFKVDPGLMFDASARAGFLVTDSALLYGRVGYANSKLDVTATNTAVANGSIRQDKRKGGLLLGAGAEFAIMENFRLRTEYRRSKTGDLKSDQALVGIIFDF